MTVEILGDAYVEIGNLVCSPGFEERTRKPHVAALAESIRDTVLIHAPMVRERDSQVVAGEDRVAAYCVLDRPEIRVTLVECSDEELEAIRAAENKFRRQDISAEELLARVEALAPTIPAPGEPVMEWEAASATALLDDMGLTIERHPLTGPGRPKKARTVALEAVAEETGKSVESVRKATERAAAKRDKASIELWGTEQPTEWLDRVQAQRRLLTGASDKVTAAMASLTRLQTRSPIDDALSHELHLALQEKAHAIRALRPACVCAWCKNTVPDCTACGGRGYLTESQAAMVPEELKAGSVVVVGGKVVTDVFDAPLVSTPHTMPAITAAEADAAFAELERANGGEDFLAEASLDDLFA